MVKENACWPLYYGPLRVEVFAPDWYHRGNCVNHDHSIEIINAKERNRAEYFVPKMKELIEELKKEGKIDKIDLVSIIPKSDLGYSETMESVAKEIAKSQNIHYEEIITRTRTGRRNLGGNSAADRFKQTAGSMKLNRNLKDDCRILLLDDTKATGITFLECVKILMEVGIKMENIHCVCLGISHNFDLYPLRN